MTGRFLGYFAEEKFPEACGILDFGSMAKTCFWEQGVAPNVTENRCAEWMAGIISSPCVGFLRGAAQDASTASAADLMAKFLQAAREHFAEVDPMKTALELLESLVVLFEVSVGKSQSKALKHKPSAIRCALGVVGEADSKSRVGLALRHGELGKALMQVASDVVTATRNDEMGTEAFKEVLNDLTRLSEGSEDVNNEYGRVFEELAVVLNLWSSSYVEERADDLKNAIDVISRLVAQWWGRALSGVTEESAQLVQAAVGSVIPKGAGAANSADVGKVEVKPDPAAAAAPETEEAACLSAPLLPPDITDKLQGFVGYLKEELLPKSNQILHYLNKAILLNKKVKAAYVTAKLPHGQTLPDFEAGLVQMQNHDSVMEQTVIILEAVACFGPRTCPSDAAALLSEWSAWWQAEGADSSPRAPTLPIMESLFRGIRATKPLAMRFENLDDGAGLNNFASKPIATVISTLAQPSLAAVLTREVDKFVGESLHKVDRVSYTPSLTLQDSETINKCLQEDRESTVLKLLLGGSTSYMQDTVLPNLETKVGEVLKVHDQAIPSNAVLPHHSAVSLARQCISVVADAGQVSSINLSPPHPSKPRGRVIATSF